MTAVADPAAPALDVSKMSKAEKLAALLIILGPDSAAQILKTLSPQDLETVSAEMARLPLITQQARTEILREMSEVAMAAATSLRGGMPFAQAALEQALGSYRATDILNRVSTQRGSLPAVQRLAAMEVRHLLTLIREEHPQVIALVASHLRPDKASELLARLQPELRDQIVERLAAIEPTPVEAIEEIVEVLQRRLSGLTTRGLLQTGGVKSAADVLNALNKELSKAIISSLEARNAELGQAIRQKMFTFADLALLDIPALQKVMREVDLRDLALALKKSDETVKKKLFSAISRRAAETVNDEMSFMGAVRLKEVEAAQMRIIEIVRKLEAEGEIDLETRPEAAP